MKVFISWSGGRSKAVAEALDEWLPKVIQVVRPFVSTNSIDKGTRWREVLADEMEQSRFSIICLTPENLVAPWILFEAGALSKRQQGNVCTYLLGLEPADIGDPLSQFQATVADKEQTKELIHVINKLCGESSLSEPDFDETFEVWWPKLDQRLRLIPETQPAENPRRADRELLEDILATVRTMQKERDIRSRESDYFMLQYLEFLRAATENDPKIKNSPELQRMLGALENKLLHGDVPSMLSTYILSRYHAARTDPFKELAERLLREEQPMTNEEKSGMEANSNSENSDS
jgi:hypothetical protein